MSKVMSFAEAAQAIPAATVPVNVEATPVVAETQSLAPAVRRAGVVANPNADISGEWERKELKIPELSIVQKVGGLADNFPFSSIVLNKEYILSDGKTPITLTVLRIDKSYEEIVEYGSDVRARTVGTLAEVHRLGGTIAKSEDAAGNEIEASWRPIAKALVCIHGSDADAQSVFFPYEHDGKAFAFALWTMRGVAYSRAATFIRTAGDFAYRAGLSTGTFRLGTKTEKFNQNSFAAPVMSFGSKNTPEFRTWVASFNTNSE